MKNRWVIAIVLSATLHTSIYFGFSYLNDDSELPRKIDTGSPVSLSLQQFITAKPTVTEKATQLTQPKPQVTQAPSKKPTPSKTPSTSKTIKKAPKLKPIVAKQLPTEPTISKPSPKPTSKTKVIQKASAQPQTPSTVTPPRLFSANGLPIMSNPTFLSKIPPIYPRRAIQRKQEGKVILDATIDGRGLVKEVDIFQSSGHKALDISAIRAVKKWKFEPPENTGKNTYAVVRIPVNFQLKQKQARI